MHFLAQQLKIKKIRTEEKLLYFIKKHFFSFSGNETFLYFLKKSFSYIPKNGTF